MGKGKGMLIREMACEAVQLQQRRQRTRNVEYSIFSTSEVSNLSSFGACGKEKVFVTSIV